jgi:hypothetical protein
MAVSLPTSGPQTVTDTLEYRRRFRAYPGAPPGMKAPHYAAWVFATPPPRRWTTRPHRDRSRGSLTTTDVARDTSPRPNGLSRANRWSF